MESLLGLEKSYIDNLERYERKWVLDYTSMSSGRALIKSLPLVLGEAYPQRSVHSLYFDTEDLVCFQLHESGSRNRYKVRVRWYGDLYSEVVEAQVELKIRQERMVRKLTYPLGRVSLSLLSEYKYLKEISSHLDVEVVELLLSLKPKVYTSYDRLYFSTYGDKVRVTLDNNLKFFRYQAGAAVLSQGMQAVPNSILELKYPFDLNHELSPFLPSFPGAQTRNSKYSTAIKGVFGV